MQPSEFREPRYPKSLDLSKKTKLLTQNHNAIEYQLVTENRDGHFGIQDFQPQVSPEMGILQISMKLKG